MGFTLRPRLISAIVGLALSATLAPPAVADTPPTPTTSQQGAPSRVTLGVGEHYLNTPYQWQRTSYWCGPTAISMALGIRGIDVSQETLAAFMGTSPDYGTTADAAVTALRHFSGAPYEAVYVPDGGGQAAKATIWSRIQEDIDGGFAVVTGIGAPPHTYPYYDNPTMIHHLFVVDGYDTNYGTVRISDPAYFNGNSQYWITLDDLVWLMEGHFYNW
ncbi:MULTISPECIES: C39 family peptidase [unclassified Nocardioides]|uniref:C39 family peptidase n=1 Tax=unclassified Nocardioides TaxID=2615069 RepID=UPI0006FA9616|nr:MULTISPECIES: C39 family peptidase [unclassified Nocardioides]KQY56505.1 hypothetical protein ASD30_09205 [Nocardioides sp. Root140]KQZ75262.1 hypothetical protein ASD66_02515 [Nocardioides sp. Root151]KRF14341.1 hypothetical protein ASH02_08310 [Nocardioides sp. Soil796]